MNDLQKQKIAIVGGGPSGLMAAEVLVQAGFIVDLYDSMPSVGRKVLMAGKSGLNITHDDPFEQFSKKYSERQPQLEPMLAKFQPDDVRAWTHKLGVETFVGSSGMVFPKEMKAAPLLRAWLHRLRKAGVRFHMRHRWTGWDESHMLCFETPQGMLKTKPDATVLALGGGSWKRLGSDAKWIPLLLKHNIEVATLKPANCGFDVIWSEHFRARFSGQPIKSVILSFTGTNGVTHRKEGELVVTKNGVEGSLIYAFSAIIRDEIAASGSAEIYLDLTPGRTISRLVSELSKPQGSRTMAKHLRNRAGIEGVKAGLLRELPKNIFSDSAHLAATIKALPLKLVATRPIDEAISTAGGVKFETMDNNLMLRSMPGVFCSGEMLDWEAPTGGYLLTACFASGRAAGEGVLSWLESK
ncbi:MAG: TIGR03862 family flavoprotein [Gammaproteobacteria bacterium]|nr:TIGR03862 family flavoprotein [Gammaproteobacteria bacterium]